LNGKENYNRLLVHLKSNPLIPYSRPSASRMPPMPPAMCSSWVRTWSSWPPLLVRRLRAKVALLSAQRIASAGVSQPSSSRSLSRLASVPLARVWASLV
jgi:hypothetical protein